MTETRENGLEKKNLKNTYIKKISQLVVDK